MMTVCQNCGSSNEAQLTACMVCGSPLVQTDEDGLSAFRRLSGPDSDSSPPETPAVPEPDTGPDMMPDWLELLLAKYGEESPTLVNVAPPGSGAEDLPGPATNGAGEDSQAETMMSVPAPATPESSDAAADLDDIPDWLTGMAGSAAGEPTADAPAAEQGEEDVPEWLSNVGGSSEEPAAPVERGEASADAPSGTGDEEGTPEWLAALQEKSAVPAAEEDATPEVPTEDEMPDWMADLRREVAEPAVTEPESPEEPSAVEEMETPAVVDGEEVPDWLADLNQAAEPATRSGAETPPEGGKDEEAAGETQDWLAGLREAGAAAAVQTDPPVADKGAEMPDWLEDNRELPPVLPPAVEGAEESAAALDQESGTDWLSNLREVGTAAPAGDETLVPEEPPAVVEGGGEEVEVPSWVRDLGGTESEATGDTADAPAVEDIGADTEKEEVPGWLSELVSTPETEEVLVDETPPAEEVQPPVIEAEVEAVEDASDFLAEIGISEVSAVAPPETDAGEVPDWLIERDAETGMDVGAEPEEEVPAWLAELKSMDETGEVALIEEEPAGPEDTLASSSPEPEAVAAGDEDLDWQAALLAMEEQSSSAEEGEVEPTETAEPAAAEETPDWLETMVAARAAAAGTVEPEPPPVEAAPEAVPELSEAEMPEWMLKLKPGEGPAEPTGTEPGLGEMGDTAAAEESAVEDTSIAALRAKAGYPDVPDMEGADLFRDISTQKGQAGGAPDGEGGGRSRVFTILLWGLIFLVLAMGIAIVLMAVLTRMDGLLGAGPAFHRYLESPAAVGLVSSVQHYRDPINRLAPDSVVLVAVDFGPGTEGEMGPLATATMQDLLGRDTRVVMVSLRPEGAAMAQRLLDEMQVDYPVGEQTLNLGYLPGQAIGIRSLDDLPDMPLFGDSSQTMSSQSGWQDVNGLQDVVLVVDLADSPQTVRWWVEQTPATGLAGRPLLAAVSTGAAPAVRPYYNPTAPEQGQLQGVISGITGAAAYEVYLGKPGRATRGLAAQSAAHLGLVVVGLTGTFVGFRNHAVELS